MIYDKVPGGGLLRGGGHWTRDVAFSQDGKKMFVSVGSKSNNDDTDDNPDEHHRAAILEINPDGSGVRVFASGIRNPVGIAVQPAHAASCGRRSTSATAWATTWSPTTSPGSRTAASTAGPGTTSAATRTRATRANTPS